MVSNVHDSDEGWSAVDEIADDAVCNLDQLIGPELTDKHGAALTMSEKVTLRKQSKLPTVVHFCQLYRVGIYMWGKWNPKLQNLFACDQPYLLEPPSHIGTMRLTVEPDQKIEKLERVNAIRNAYAICVLTKMLNEALRDYRKATCTEAQYEAGQQPVWQLSDLSEQDLALTDLWKGMNAI
eukprot:21335-Heterococcus_DN1.PRE.4